MWADQFKLPLAYDRSWYLDQLPENLKTDYSRAVVYYDRNLYFNAIGQLERALIGRLPNAVFSAFIGRCYQKLGQPYKAFEYHRQALEVDSGFHESLSFVAQFYFERRNFTRAADHYRRHVKGGRLTAREWLNCLSTAGWIEDEPLATACRKGLKTPQQYFGYKKRFPVTLPRFTKEQRASALEQSLQTLGLLNENQLTYHQLSTAEGYDLRQNEAVRQALDILHLMSFEEPGNMRIFNLYFSLFERFKRPELVEQTAVLQVGLLPREKTGYHRLAALYSGQGRLRPAISVYRRYLRLLLSERGALGWQSGPFLRDMVKLYARLGRPTWAHAVQRIGDIYTDTAGQAAANRKSALMALYREAPDSPELISILMQLAREEKNDYMYSRLNKQWQKLLLEEAILPR